MSLLTKLFGRETSAGEIDTRTLQERCHHSSAVPHWDDPADIGKEELATSYVCQSCFITMDPETYDQARQAEMERLRA